MVVLDSKTEVQPRFLSLAAASAYSGLSVESLRRLIRQGKLPKHKPTRRVLVAVADLDLLVLGEVK